ncbi:MAG TPA: bifunctional DNA primase/polymerase [Sphingomicrobium sp.]|nr:bifunctional DNA primase/polymerase [Sphingomicrobium sp.]
MTEGPYSKVGARLVEKGYAAIPIMPGTKRPGELRKGEWVGKQNWREEYTRRLPTKWELQLWATSEAGVGVVCGPASNHLVGVDIDTDDRKIKNAIVSALPGTTYIKRGAKGETHFYRAPNVKVSKSWNLPKPDGKKYRVCDLIGPGRQTLLPPTIHPDTQQPYVWLAGDALEDISPDELPELTPEHVEAIDVALAQFGYEEEPERPKAKPARFGGSVDTERPVHRQLNDGAIANLDAWVPLLPAVMQIKKRPQGYEAVAVWRASNTGQAIAARKLNLKFDSKGIQDFGDGPRPYTPLNLVMAAFDMGNDLEMAFKWLTDALGWNAAPVTPLKFKGPSKVPSKMEASVETAAAKVPPVADNDNDYDAKIERLTHCEGLVGDIIDWIEKSARRPNRALALGTAVTVIGTLIGRRVAGPTGSASHVYVVGVAPTAAGKQHPIDCLSLLMRAAGAKAHIGPSEFISFPAIINMMLRQPLALAAQDEFGAYLKRINSRKASTYEQGISKTLRSLWGISFGDFQSAEYAGKPSTTICAPALSIFGLSTPDEFYSGLQDAELKNGFLNRFLVIAAGRGKRVAEPACDKAVPDDIAGALGEIYRWGGAPDSLGTSRLNDSSYLPTPLTLKWTDEAKNCFSELEDYMDQRLSGDEGAEHYMGRTAEIAIRLATIRAVGRWGPSEAGPTVDHSDVEWGRDIALACGERLAKDAKMFMAENERQAWANKILAIVRERGAAKPRDIQRKIKCALKSSELRDHLDNLAEAGFIEPIKGEVRGRACVVEYKFKTDK